MTYSIKTLKSLVKCRVLCIVMLNAVILNVITVSVVMLYDVGPKKSFHIRDEAEQKAAFLSFLYTAYSRL
jgi:hypothetical protein